MPPDPPSETRVGRRPVADPQNRRRPSALTFSLRHQFLNSPLKMSQSDTEDFVREAISEEWDIEEGNATFSFGDIDAV